jgi:hypothetical protein
MSYSPVSYHPLTARQDYNPGIFAEESHDKQGIHRRWGHHKHAGSRSLENRPAGTLRSYNTPDGLDAADNSGGVQSSSKTDVSISRQNSAEITITTTDGDTVTLNTSSLFEASFTSYNQSGETSDGSYNLSASSASFKASREFSLSVEGELDKEELRDISKAIRQVNKTMRDLFSGDMEQALKRAAKLYNLDSISGIEAVAKVVNSVSVTQQITDTGTETAAMPEDPQPEPTALESQAAAPAGTQEEVQQPGSEAVQSPSGTPEEASIGKAA